MGVERVEAVFPELTVDPDPLPSLNKGLALQSQQVVATQDPSADQAGTLQNTDVLRRRGERNGEGCCEIGHPHRTFTK